MALLDDLKTLDYGANITKGLIEIGRSLGEARRQREADEAVTQVFSGVAKSRDPFAFMQPENISLLRFLNTTPEGQQGLAGAQQGLGLTKAMSDIQMSRQFDLSPGSGRFNASPDATSATKVAEMPNRPGNNKYIWTNPTEAETQIYEGLKSTTRRLMNSAGAISDVTSQKLVARDPNTNELVVVDNEPMTKDREVKQSVGGVYAGNGGGSPNEAKNIVIPNIYTVGVDKPTDLGAPNSKNLDGLIAEFRAANNGLEKRARDLGPKSTTWLKDIFIAVGISSPPKSWDEIVSLRKTDPTAYYDLRSKLQNDVLIKYIDAYTQNEISLETLLEWKKNNGSQSTGSVKTDKPGVGKPQPAPAPAQKPGAPKATGTPTGGTGLQFKRPGS